jgi:adenine deaminase
MVKLGAVYEICALGLMPYYARIKLAEAVKIISELGARNVVLSSDYFHEWFPLSSESMRMIIGSLLDCGVSPSDITAMVCTNPRRLLGLPPASDIVTESGHQSAQVPSTV